jgi:hypothetical protein
MDNEVSVQSSAGTDSGAGAGSDPADMPGKGSGDRARIGIAGPHPYVGFGTTRAIAGETGAIHKGAILASAAGRIPGTEQEVLGAASVGARILLRDGRRGRRRDDQSVHREPEMGRRRPGFQDHSAYQALSRLSAGDSSGGFSRNHDFQS